jgi:large subunit ribosomal protein L22
MHATAKHIRISPKKANLVAGLVRRKGVTEALDILKFTPKKAAPLIAKVIASAAANAKANLKQDIEKLQIKEIIINEGTTFKRSLPISRGRTHPIRKRNSHIKVFLETKPEEKVKKVTPAPKAEPATKPETPNK